MLATRSLSAGPVRVRVLGQFEIEGFDRVGSRKARTLLKVLALAKGSPVSGDALAEAVWPDDPPRAAAKELSVLVSRLRSVLGPDCLVHSDAGYAFRPDWLDLSVASALSEQAAVRLVERSFHEARNMSHAALELFRGPLLADEPYADWAEPHRNAAAELANQIRQTAARAALSIGHFEEAIEMARKALESDPYDEMLVRILMIALARSGRQASAVAEYGRFRTWLADELGISPSPETDAVHTAILKGERVPYLDVGAQDWAENIELEAAPQAAPSTALAGRAAEIAALDSALGVVSAGEQRMVLIEGEMGSGKTRLLEAWTAAAAEAGVTVLQARCRPVGKLFPFQGLLDAIAAEVAKLSAAEAENLLGGELGVLEPLLREPRRFRRVPTPAPESLFDPILEVVRRLAETGTTVLALDDIHHAGQATWDWLDFVAEMASDVPLLVVVTRTSGHGPQDRNFYTIPLSPLDELAASEIVGAELAPTLLLRSGGNPLLLTELAATGSADELPTSIVQAVSKLLDSLGSTATVLRAAAVLGRKVDLSLVESVLGLSARELLEHVREASERRLLLDEGTEIRFNHEVIREGIIAATPPAWRDFILGKATSLRDSDQPERPLLRIDGGTA